MRLLASLAGAQVGEFVLGVRSLAEHRSVALLRKKHANKPNDRP